MSREGYIRTSVAIAATRLFPTTIRDAVISDVKFTEAFGFKADAIIRLGRDDLTFQCSTFCDAIRQAFDPRQEPVPVDNTHGETWEVRVLADKSPVEITLERGTTRLLVSRFGLLCPDKDVRLGTLLNEADKVCLLPKQIAPWKELLDERAPTDDEVLLIQEDLKDTPVAVAAIIRESLAAGSVSLDAWVPRSVCYYERLVGQWESGLSLDGYAKRVAPRQFSELLKWQETEGLKLALLLTPQPYLSTALAEAEISDDALGEVISWLASKGDAMSCAAGIEIALPRLARHDGLKEPLARLLKVFVAGKPAANVDPIKLLSCLFLVVYGEIAHCRIHAAKPPFWRKLAAIAQASLIARCIADIGGDATELARWLQSVRSEMYLLQCFADLRVEPRWLPDFGLPRQLRNEICGRVWTAVARLAPGVLEPELTDLLMGDGDGSLKRQFNAMHACLPGPLEGSVAPPVELSAEEVARIRDDLSSATITIESVSTLANAAFVVRFPAELADMAADAIARADYRLSHDDKSAFVAHLLGLASAAAIARSSKLADALFLLLRTYRHFHPDELTIEDASRIAIIACASRSELADWCKCLGDFMTDCAFQPITVEEATCLHSHLVHLCHLVPELWSTCGQAEAALRSVLMS
jgi:hypothetical protein